MKEQKKYEKLLNKDAKHEASTLSAATKVCLSNVLLIRADLELSTGTSYAV